MVHVQVLGAYINFKLMYRADNIFLVITIKDLINKDFKATTPFKLAIGTEPSVSHLRVLFCPCSVKNILHMLGQSL